jgi:hypothetical protein
VLQLECHGCMCGRPAFRLQCVDRGRLGTSCERIADRPAEAARQLEEANDRTPAVTRNPQKAQRTPPSRKVKKKAMVRKASFRRKKVKGSGRVAKPEAEQSPSGSPWLCRSTWMGMKDEERWLHLPVVLRKAAKPGTSFTFRQGAASVDVLVRDRAYWLRSAGQVPAGPRNFAWRKLGGPVPAWRAAAAAAGIA